MWLTRVLYWYVLPGAALHVASHNVVSQISHDTSIDKGRAASSECAVAPGVVRHWIVGKFLLRKIRYARGRMPHCCTLY